jgi:hypothetical protein
MKACEQRCAGSLRNPVRHRLQWQQAIFWLAFDDS